MVGSLASSATTQETQASKSAEMKNRDHITFNGKLMKFLAIMAMALAFLCPNIGKASEEGNDASLIRGSQADWLYLNAGHGFSFFFFLIQL
jgi:hypothetical protein